MKPAAFDYHRPESATDALQLLVEFGEDGKLLAGGQSLVPMLALRVTYFEHLIDISRLDELKGIERRDGALWIGAVTTEAAVEVSPLVADAVPLLARTTPLIGHFQIRNKGTVGGSMAHADPAAEYPAVALALDAELEVLSPQGRRAIPAQDFFTGLWSTALEPDEMLVGMRFPVWTGRCGFAVEEFARRYGDFAIAGAVAAIELDDHDRITRCGIGLLGLGSTPVRPVAAEAAVVGRGIDEVDPAELGELAMAGLDDIPADMHGSPEYRRQVGAAMVARAWAAAGAEARASEITGAPDG